MSRNSWEHYLSPGLHTYPGSYGDYFRSLTDNLPRLGELLCRQVIHRFVLRGGNTGRNEKQLYGDMTRVPWHRARCEDDLLPTAAAMTAELFRRDPRGFVSDRREADKLILSCRNFAVLFTAVLRAKGVPCRVRSGFAPYLEPNRSCDHWINEVWNQAESRWVVMDASFLYDDAELGFPHLDIPPAQYHRPAECWLDYRAGKHDGSYFVVSDGEGTNGKIAMVRGLFYDFYCLMNYEINYHFLPGYIYTKEQILALSEEELRELDQLALLLRDPDANLEALVEIYETNRKFRTLYSPLVHTGLT